MSNLGKQLAKTRASTAEPSTVQVPDSWGDGAYFAMPLTLADSEKIDQFAGESSAKRMAYTIVLKLLDSEGGQALDIGDVTELLNQPQQQIMALYVAILNAGDTSVEDHIKN